MTRKEALDNVVTAAEMFYHFDLDDKDVESIKELEESFKIVSKLRQRLMRKR